MYEDETVIIWTSIGPLRTKYDILVALIADSNNIKWPVYASQPVDFCICSNS